MVRRSLIFVWGNPPTPGARWRLGLFHFTRPPRNNRDIRRRLELGRHQLFRYHVLRVSLRGLLAWGGAAAFAAYLAGAALVVRSLDARSPHNRVTYLDLVSPARWGGIDRLRGETMIADAKDALAAGRYGDALGLLRAGLSRAPENHEARLLLAGMYAGSNLVSPAIDLLTQGVRHAPPDSQYIETLTRLLDQSARETEVPALLEQAMAAGEKTRSATGLSDRYVRALREAGREDDAVNFLRRTNPAAPELRQLEIDADLARGRYRDALAKAERWLVAEPRSFESIRLVATSRLRLGDHPGLRETIKDMRAKHPSTPDTFVVGAALAHEAGWPDEAVSTAETLVLRHGSDPAIYPVAAAIFGRVGFSRGLDILEKESRALGYPVRHILWARLRLAEKKRDWAQIAGIATEIHEAKGPRPAVHELRWLRTLTLLAETCMNDGSGSRVALVGSFSGVLYSCETYIRVVEALLEAGRFETADDVVTLAEGPYPASIRIAALRDDARKGLSAGADAASARDIGKLPPALSDMAAFSEEFSLRLSRADRTGALDLIAALRRARPAWLADASSRIDSLELPLLADGGDPLRLQVIARNMLARGVATPGNLLSLARDTHPRHPEHARTLLAEILRAAPQTDQALALMRVWFPPPAVDPAEKESETSAPPPTPAPAVRDI